MAEAAPNNTLDRMFYAAGDLPKPATNTQHIRHYTHNLCPFSARARYAFAAKGIPFQNCETDLQAKAQWHKDANGGTAPLLELTTGDIIIESSVIIQFAIDSNPAGGIQLYPSDPVEAAKLRIKMEKFWPKVLLGFPMIHSRGEDVEKINKYKNECLPLFEEMCAEANGKFLFGTDEITMLDVHCAPFFELFYLMDRGVYSNVEEIVQLRQTAP